MYVCTYMYVSTERDREKKNVRVCECVHVYSGEKSAKSLKELRPKC